MDCRLKLVIERSHRGYLSILATDAREDIRDLDPRIRLRVDEPDPAEIRSG